MPPIRPGDLVELLADHDTPDGTLHAGQRGECTSTVGRAAVCYFDAPARILRDGEAVPLGMEATVPLAKLRRSAQSNRLT